MTITTSIITVIYYNNMCLKLINCHDKDINSDHKYFRVTITKKWLNIQLWKSLCYRKAIILSYGHDFSRDLVMVYDMWPLCIKNDTNIGLDSKKKKRKKKTIIIAMFLIDIDCLICTRTTKCWSSMLYSTTS